MRETRSAQGESGILQAFRAGHMAIAELVAIPKVFNYLAG